MAGDPDGASDVREGANPVAVIPDAAPRAAPARAAPGSDTDMNLRIGVRMSLARRLAGLSPEALAMGLGWLAEELHATEAGRRRISASELMKAADLLRLPVSWFYGPAAATLSKAERRARALHAAALEGLDHALGNRDAAERAALAAHAARLAQGLDQDRAAIAGGLGRPGLSIISRDTHVPGEHDGATPHPPSRPAPSVPRRRRVLVVDDAVDVLVTTGAFVEAAGYEVVRARDADVALVILAGEQPVDAIVTDYAMPTLSGVELLVQAAQIRPGVPAMIITGFADVVGLAELPGSVEVLHKPFRRARFTAMLDALLNGSGTEAPAPAGTVPAAS